MLFFWLICKKERSHEHDLKPLTTEVKQGVPCQKYQDDNKFCMFHCQLFHSSLGVILEPLRPAMTTPEVTQCPDGHFCHVIYGLGLYIADYPEQALLACIVQGWCAK